VTNRLKDHPSFTIVGAVAAVAAVVVALLSLIEPAYALVTDLEVCGYTEITEVTYPHKWNECENPNKIIGYRFSETVTQNSGWVDGGHDQNWHCTNVKREKERAVSESIVWSNQRSSEQHRKDIAGHVTYKYHCSIDAKWGPIYQVERWEGCGEAPPVSTTVKKPKTCFDKTKRIGWKWKWQ